MLLFKKNNEENVSEEKRPGVKWIMNVNGQELTQYIFGKSVCVGTESIDGPDVLLKRNRYIYLCIQFDIEKDKYYVITDFDGPFFEYPHGEAFKYGIDTFVLL